MLFYDLVYYYLILSITLNRNRKEGGSIGLDLTGVVADIYMAHWDKEFQLKLQQHGINMKLYKRYKDDINLILHKIITGDRSRREKEMLMLKEIMSLADSIHPSIKVTGDIPSNYQDERLPILDLKVWIGEINERMCKVITSHYIKDVSTRAVINERSSHSINMKINVMVNSFFFLYVNDI